MNSMVLARKVVKDFKYLTTIIERPKMGVPYYVIPSLINVVEIVPTPTYAGSQVSSSPIYDLLISQPRSDDRLVEENDEKA